MTFGLTFAIAATGIVIGIAIGAVGIGGVLLVPFLTLTLGIDVKHAIAAVLLSYVPSCIVAVGTLCKTRLHPLARGGIALPGCIANRLARRAGRPAGAGGAARAGDRRAAVGGRRLCVAAAAGHRDRATPAGPGDAARTWRWHRLRLRAHRRRRRVRAAAGLLLLDTPVLAAIGLGQAIALPIAGLASLANIVAGIMDIGLAAGLAAALTLGIAIGTPIAHALPQLLLRRLLGSVVVLAGLAMILRTAARL